MSLVPKPTDILRKVVVATAGDLAKPGFDDGGVKRYVTAWGGRFSADLDESVTHLLVSTREMRAKKSHPRVCQGQKRQKLEIVTVDWLEDSISKKKKQPAGPYSLKRRRKEANAAKKRELDKHKNIEKAGYFMNPDKYRVYTDSTFFRYEVSLTKDRDEGRFMLTLFESVAKPHLYHAALKYWHAAASSDGGKMTAAKRPRPRKASEHLFHQTPGSFEREFAAFTKFFRQKTGVPWDRRLAVFTKGKGNTVPGLYVYEPPRGGKPVGLVQGRNPHDENHGAGSFDTACSARAPDDGPPGHGNASPDRGEDEKSDPVGGVDEAVRAVLGPAVAANARADVDITACAAVLETYKAERVADAPA